MRLNRNRILLFLTALLLTAFLPRNTNAQTILLEPAEFYIGTTHGTNASMLLFNPNVRQTYLLGYNGGVSLRYVTEKHFGLQLELNYAQRGWNEEGNLYARQLNYLELPFLTHVYFGDKSRFIFNLGPKLGYLLNESVVTNNASASTAEQHILPASNKFDYGLAAGFGYNLHTRKTGVYQLELRVYYGLSDVFPNSKSDFFSTSNHLNASLNLGWYFQLTGRK